MSNVVMMSALGCTRQGRLVACGMQSHTFTL